MTMFATQVVTQTSDTAGDNTARATVTQTVRYVVNTLTIRVTA